MKSQAGANGDKLSRRRFLGFAASAAGGSLLGPFRGVADEETLLLPAGAPSSRVVQTQSIHAVEGPEGDRALLGEMLDGTLMALTGKSTVRQAWHTILQPDDVIGIKFNRSGQQIIATSDAMADTLIGSIVEAGWRPEQIVCIEASPGTEKRHGTTPARRGYDKAPTGFGSGRDQFASVLRQVTALIDVPYLKAHNIAGMTCALKNVAYGLIKHPARYHANGCSPYIADIFAAEPIRTKIRLCLVDALRVAYDDDLRPSGSILSDQGVLLASRDPVATDTVGLSLLNDVRSRYELPLVARSANHLPYLAAAQRSSLGLAAWHRIELLRVRP